jgi:hypothetical protein
MKKRISIAVVSKHQGLHKHEDLLGLLHELGIILAKGEALVLTHFTPTLSYFKESFLTSSDRMISLSPACSKEEHETIFKYNSLPEENVLYTGLGKELTILTLLRSADVIVCLDEGALEEVKSMKDENLKKEVFLLSERALKPLESIVASFGKS